ncbi:Flagellar biosynthetic protein FlhB [Candidatus Jidaibacter acanthamoeba]|uniref:Flagellar biosynthetic protein FlhB n=1 Tax=Candidatus Jidaibacter acanthamoebae TaxID=86105 RepID=A0A0C1QHE4_9RICK|nr:flagellar biosynthesis protein FlhB [Candidatus Jidaibacter acanthamoeba]KIE04964.1 Flagellar biosynthetic protein FlhB [Candidatus Jidaibacter acanthamoeba]
MSDDKDTDQKTEEPTQRRIDEAFKKGQVITSKEVNNFITLLAFTILLSWVYPYLLKMIQNKISFYIYSAHQLVIGDNWISIMHLVKRLIFDFLFILSIPLVIAVITIIFSNFAQHGFVLSAEVLKFDLSKISPMKGFGRIFSMKSVVELIKGIFKMIAISMAIYLAISSELKVLPMIHTLSFYGFLALTLKFITKMMIAVCIVMGAIAAIDYFYQRYEFYKNLRMTKEEIKEEYKQTEGSPEIKSKLKSIRMERAQKRMMASVPSADVIITNPTHFAVALKYDQDNMPAPQVIAKGQDNIALRIKEVAIENMIPVIEDAPLARALYSSTEIDQYVPFEHYKAVAEVITYVMRLRGKKFGKK